jgi:hypothetical protein
LITRITLSALAVLAATLRINQQQPKESIIWHGISLRTQYPLVAHIHHQKRTMDILTNAPFIKTKQRSGSLHAKNSGHFQMLNAAGSTTFPDLTCGVGRRYAQHP